MNEEVFRLMLDEGFRGSPYRCSEGYLTVGHGFNIEVDQVHPIVRDALQGVDFPITEEFSRSILTKLVKVIWDRLYAGLPEQPEEVIRILTNMQYQLGYRGLMRFKNMWKAIHAKEYRKAAAEMLDSRWATQTPNRAKRLAERMAAV